MSETTKGALFLALMIPIGVRFLIKTGNNDTRLNWVDYSITAAIIAAVVAMNV